MEVQHSESPALVKAFYMGLRVAEVVHGVQSSDEKAMQFLPLLADVADGRSILVETTDVSMSQQREFAQRILNSASCFCK